jgi:hypothetical protein
MNGMLGAVRTGANRQIAVLNDVNWSAVCPLIWWEVVVKMKVVGRCCSGWYCLQLGLAKIDQV